MHLDTSRVHSTREVSHYISLSAKHKGLLYEIFPESWMFVYYIYTSVGCCQGIAGLSQSFGNIPIEYIVFYPVLGKL